MSASTRRSAADQLGTEVELRRRAEPAEPGDLDRAVGLDDRRTFLVVDAEDPHPRPEVGLRLRQGAHVRLDPAGRRGVILAKVADLQVFHHEFGS